MVRGSPYRALPVVESENNIKQCCTAELSQNMMSSELEKELKTAMIMENRRNNPRCRSVFAVVLVFILVCVVAWLTAISVLYKVHEDFMVNEVGTLRVEMAELMKKVKSLEEIMSLEEEIFTDDDETYSNGENTHDDEKDSVRTQIHNLNGVEIVEDGEIIGDDEDGDDDIYPPAGSGDYTNPFMDYDKPKSMSREETEDILGKVLEKTPQDEAEDRPSKMSELRKKLKEEDEKHFDAGRHRRNIDGVSSRELLSGDAETSWYPDSFRPLTRANHRRLRFYGPDSPARAAASQKSERPFIAAHFNGNTTHLTPDNHPEYIGNGLLRTGHEVRHSTWSAATWTSKADSTAVPTMTHTGHATIHESGVYFVYAQIYFVDSHDVSMWTMYREQGHIKEPLIQCTTGSITPSEYAKNKPNSCYSAAAVHLHKGDGVVVENSHGERAVMMHPEKSFLGLIKLAESPNGIDSF